MIEFRKVTADNIEEIMALDIRENQKCFMETTNLTSFADAYTLNEEGIPATPLAVYVDEVVVGFIMYIYDTLDHESFEKESFYQKKSYFIWHMMIGKDYQGKGYGKLAFKKMLVDIETMPNGEAEYISLCYHIDNKIAKALYASFDFVDTGIITDQSMLAIKRLERD